MDNHGVKFGIYKHINYNNYMTGLDKLTEYGYGFQVKVIAAMVTDRSFLQQIADIIRSDYFESDANNWLLDVILTHFREYKTPPSKDVLKVKLTELSDKAKIIKDRLDKLG